MSLVLRQLGMVVVLAWPAASAWAQSEGQGSDRFHAEKNDAEDAEEDSTLIQGSLTSTSFFYRENAPIADTLAGGMVGVENASEFDRVFTDLRLKLDARHIKGASWDFRADARARIAPTAKVDSARGDDVVIPLQASVFGGNEYYLREFNLKRYGASSDLTIGRQYVSELAATKFDGIRIDYAKDEHWTYIGFAGLYPDRASRSVFDDYPKAAPAMVGGERGKRILPVVAGGGGAYRFDKFYGSVGVVGVLPRADERLAAGPRAEQPRIFTTASGYYRRSPKFDAYHFVVVDLVGSNVSDRDELEGTLASIPLTNLSLGVNFRPNPALRLSASINRVDTEVLNVIAQTRLEEPAAEVGIVQNNIEVQRISQQSARVGVSGAFKQNRFEISANGLVRSRPEINLTQPDDTVLSIPRAQAFELTLRALDRRSIHKHRILASATRIKGFGGTNFYRTDAYVFRAGASREIKDGLGEYEIDLRYIQSADSNRGSDCGPVGGLDPFAVCFGSSAVNTIGVGGLVFYRPKADWLVLLGANLGSQAISIIDTSATPPAEVSQPRILIMGANLRVSYRF